MLSHRIALYSLHSLLSLEQAANPTFLAPGACFMERQFFYGKGGEVGINVRDEERDEASLAHLLLTSLLCHPVPNRPQIRTSL